ncbi:hypothetical protein, partial [uncultured Prevotella sp.]|uniref:hypothetical protein n=1 Tax=uncultured Prevotella sp. TaxID=159272 RepID=UPI00259769B8
RDASLRNEGCFFPVPAGRNLLRSTTAPERNRGHSPCITAMVFTGFCRIKMPFPGFAFFAAWREKITNEAVGLG